MMKDAPMTRFLALGVAALAFGGIAQSAAAQDDAGDKVNQVIVYGEDPCPQSDENTITVCARFDESERYRTPPNLRVDNSPRNESWTRNALSLEIIDRFGIMNCTPEGAGGTLGCTMDMIQSAYADKKASSDVRFSQLINDVRQERLSTIDAEAAATQARVEVLERAYLEKLEAERAADLPGEGERPASAQLVDPGRVGPPPPDFGAGSGDETQ